MRTRTCRTCGNKKPATEFAGNTRTCTDCASTRFQGHVVEPVRQSRRHRTIAAPVYVPEPWRPEINRPGCQQFLTFPSRRGDRLHYRDGRVETVRATA